MDTSAMVSFRFSLLGPLRAWRQGVELTLGPPQQRAVLALLLLRRGRAVGVGELVDGIWGADPPTAAVSVLRTYVSRLRRLLEPERPADGSPRLVVSLGDGYALRTDAVVSDLDRFEDLVARAGAQHTEGDDPAAVELLREALDLWQGTPLAGVPGPRAEAERRHLEERRLAALESRLRIELDLGQHARVLPELTALYEAHPLREALCELLVLALYRGGRRAEALAVYDRTRRTLVDELGIEPGPSLLAVRAGLLANSGSGPPEATDVDDRFDVVDEGDGGGLADGTGEGQGGPGLPVSAVRPSQLPTDLATFTGRRAQLDGAAALLPDRGHPQTSVIGLISGMAGAGKTTLAVHWAHRIAHRFPDGSLYVNLRGYDPSGSRMSPGDAIETFLVALGVAQQAVPEELEARAALYRGVLADRRVLIVLDNAGDSEQVTPLLPAAPGCLVIVTSRSRLSGLVARHGAHPLALNPLSAEESLELLARRLGDARVDAEPEAARAIVALCAGLPLALSIVAARAALNPGFRLAGIAEELRQDHGSLDAFAGGDAGTDARAVFSWSYHALSPEAAGLFRRLALHPGPDITVAAAAALAGVDRRRVRTPLTELTGASLLIERAPGRYVFHDLLRAYAAELSEAEDGEEVCGAALLRMHDHFLFTAHDASTVLDPFRESIPLPANTTDATPLRFNDRAEATAWLRTERYVLREIVAHAATHGFDTHAWRTAAALDVYFNRLGYWHDLLEINGAALRSARTLGSVTGEAYSLCGLGVAHSQLNHAAQAQRYLEDALELFRSADHASGQARVHRGLAYLCNRTDRRPAALDHYARAIELYRSEDDRSGEAGVLNQVAWTYILLGEHEKALERCEEAVLFYQELGDPYGEASTQDTLGYALHHLAHHAEAIGHFERSARLFHGIGDRYLESDVLRHLGDAHLATGDRDAARAARRAALALLEELGHAEADEVRRELRELGEPAEPAPGEPAV
ncbi:BTAD domain-containing putative transcriptional regulator [Streptomyces gilvifuscus]|uniref:BTAD domain-containing putative transcriptional regulator n=1 Tax=Streptomyces gilvifuscus TaxID=1550617 RepID=A0ABT5FKD8_9ACTN|nr:BTAD domain-containing putative transcriptional regulator [Streptomyces gilvifuscus]MDC2952978.1 BTAD domain-containing putative transcriptional regulator [Streptomyces gilvifuscus]